MAIWQVTTEMAAFLLLGFLVAGLLSVFISPRWLERHLGRRNLGSVFKASLFGVPLPLCSCGVIPVAASLRQHGASRAATTAFLLSTPQTGVDSIAVTYTMLGPLFAIFRPVAALLTGLLGGGMVQALVPHRDDDQRLDQQMNEQAPAVPKGLAAKIGQALDYGLVTLPADIGRALLIGVILAGLLSALIPQDFLSQYLGRGPLSIALLMLGGIPLYVCATASVPLAASFIFLGATPGAALAFLVAGPATNAATVTTISRVLGRKTMVIYLLTVAVSAFGGGLLLDWLMPRAAEAMPVLSGPGHLHETGGWFPHLSAVVLMVIMTRAWWLGRRRADCCTSADCAVDSQGNEGDAMESHDQNLEFDVTGMNCSHCSGSVERALKEMPGVTAVAVNLEHGWASVTGQGLDPEKITAAIDGLGFKAAVR
nr:permease [Candidatus Krumholzibacteria bacterium]